MRLKEQLLKHFSGKQLEIIRSIIYRQKINRAEKALKNAGTTPEYLGYNELLRLDSLYPDSPAYGYSPEATSNRGRERAKTVLRHCPKGRMFLEIGCFDGMIGYHLSRAGRKVVAIDVGDHGFDKRAKDMGVTFNVMRAENLSFPDSTFDCVFSWDAFEHIGNPAAALAEAWRVLKPGGVLYLEFGPLYNSAKGLHGYRSVKVPWCHLLFPRESLDRYVRESGKPPIDYEQLNYWSLEQFRTLFAQLPRPRYYLEHTGAEHLAILDRYPFCFAKVSREIDEFIVKLIEGVWVKPWRES